MYWYTDTDTGKRESGYGIGYKPKNPHDFYPDMDSCNEAEIEAWRAACNEWDERGEKGGGGNG
jgi:hypothetical protein